MVGTMYQRVNPSGGETMMCPKGGSGTHQETGPAHDQQWEQGMYKFVQSPGYPVFDNYRVPFRSGRYGLRFVWIAGSVWCEKRDTPFDGNAGPVGVPERSPRSATKYPGDDFRNRWQKTNAPVPFRDDSGFPFRYTPSPVS